MPGNSEDCRQHAAHYVAHANSTKDLNLRRALMDLASTWVKLAEELECIETATEENAEYPERQMANG
jgi:hypothetical protein